MSGDAQILDIGQREYHEQPYISASALKGEGRHSPSHLHAYINGLLKNEDTPDKRFGRAMHAMILEPETFSERWPVAADCCAEVASGKRKGRPCGASGSYTHEGKWYCGTHSGELRKAEDFVTVDELTRLHLIAEKLKNSPVNELLRRPGYSEHAIVWERRGLKLKTRIDRLSVDGDSATIIDLKKCQVGKASDEEMRRKILEYRYHVQAAMNVDAVQAAYGIDSENIRWYVVFIEDDYPFESNCLKADRTDIGIGMLDAMTQLDRYAACLKTGKFWGYFIALDEPHEMILPDYYRQRKAQVG